MFSLYTDEYKGFAGYLYEDVKQLNTLPPFTIGRSFYDFGKISTECCMYEAGCSFSFTNNLETDIEITWINGK